MDEIIRIVFLTFLFLTFFVFSVVIVGTILETVDFWLDGKLKEKWKEFLQ